MRRCFAVSSLLGATAVSFSAPQATAARVDTCPCTHVELRAALGPRTAQGTLSCTPRADGPIDVALYPELLVEAAVDDISRAFFYPYGFSPAAMQLRGEGAVPGEQHGIWRSFEARRGEPFTLHFLTTIPERNGTLGFRDGITQLLGGWHPGLGDRQRGVASCAIDYEVTVAPGAVGFVGSQPFGRSSPRRQSGAVEGRYLPALLAESMESRVDSKAGIVILNPGGVLPAPGGDQPIADISRGLDHGSLDELADTLGRGQSIAASMGLPTPPLLVVLAPLRQALVEPFAGGLAITDRIFHHLPAEMLHRFHRLGIWRAQLGAYGAALTRRRPPDPWPAAITADLVGAALRGRLETEVYGDVVTAPDVLESIAIIPEIDALIFAPQVPFADTYYDAVDERREPRLRLDDFDSPAPRGKLLYEKLRARLGDARLRVALRRYVETNVSFREALGPADPLLDAAIGLWLGPPQRLDYGLGEVRGTPTSIEVDVEARGPDEAAHVDTVVVEVEDAEGQVHRVQRVGPGTVTLPVPGPADYVQIDPDGRLVELHHEPGEGPRYNNSSDPRWRFLLNDIASLIGVTAGELSLQLTALLRRVHELRWRFSVSAFYDPASVGGFVAASYGFGEEITPLELSQRLGVSLAYDRLFGDSRTGAAPGHQGTLTLSWAYDDRLSPYWAYRGMGFNAHAVYAMGGLEDGSQFHFGQAGAGALGIIPFGLHHGLLLRVRADAQLGDAPLYAGLALGGRYRGLRGFEREEGESDRLRLVASAEYRHALAADARTDLGWVVLNRFEGAFFADAGYVPLTGGDCHNSVFADVGYGLRFIGDVLNLAPASLQIDMGVPINRCASSKKRLPPLTVYLAFVQSFQTF